MMRRVDRISVIVPMFNEGEHVEHLVADIAAQDFAGEIEVFVADGGSTDGSVKRLTRAAGRAGLTFTLVDNRAPYPPPRLNECIRHACGDLVVRVDCHSRYPSDYLRRCAEAAEETGAANVGGVFIPEGRTPTERAIACAIDSPFGGVNWTRHGERSGRVDVDTVYCGAFRPDVFDSVGFFDESLARDEDEELNLRIRLAGGRIVLDPAIRARYTPRSSISALASQYYEYGLWKVPVMLKHRTVLSARSLAPLAFVASTALLTLAAARSRRARRLLAAEIAAYVGSALVFGARSIAARDEPWVGVLRLVGVYPTMHVSYGLGMLHGAVRVLPRGTGGRRAPATALRRSGRPMPLEAAANTSG